MLFEFSNTPMKVIPILILSLLSGCANLDLQNAKVSSFDSDRYSNRVGIQPVTVKAINIRSTAEAMKANECPEDRCLLEGVRQPIQIPVEFGQQVEADLRAYFGKALQLENSSNRVVNVSIYQAKAYKHQKVPPAGWIPVIGLFVPDEFKIGLQLGISVAAYEGQHLVNDYRFDRTIELVDPVSADSKDVYSKILEEYRRELFFDLDKNVVAPFGLPTAPNTAQTSSLTEELQKLAEMRERGILSEAEFAQAKATLLAKGAVK